MSASDLTDAQQGPEYENPLLHASKCTKTVSHLSDIITLLLSWGDVVTDILVMRTFYESTELNGKTFFYVSLAIIIVAQISNVLAFVYHYQTGIFRNDAKIILFAIMCAPFLNFIFCYAHRTDDYLSRFIAKYFCFKLNIQNRWISLDLNIFQRLIEDKLHKHMGFILESVMEAFPQSILQLIWIRLYFVSNANISFIAMLSISLSLVSFCCKSIIFSGIFAKNLRQTLFLVFCFTTDFFSIFFFVSFVSIPSLFPFFEYKLAFGMFSMLPFSIFMSIEFCKQWAFEIWNNSHPIIFPFLAIFSFILFVCIFCCVVIILETAAMIFVAFAVFQMTFSRYPPSKNEIKFYDDLCGWIIACSEVHYFAIADNPIFVRTRRPLAEDRTDGNGNLIINNTGTGAGAGARGGVGDDGDGAEADVHIDEIINLQKNYGHFDAETLSKMDPEQLHKMRVHPLALNSLTYVNPTTIHYRNSSQSHSNHAPQQPQQQPYHPSTHTHGQSHSSRAHIQSPAFALQPTTHTHTHTHTHTPTHFQTTAHSLPMSAQTQTQTQTPMQLHSDHVRQTTSSISGTANAAVNNNSTTLNLLLNSNPYPYPSELIWTKQRDRVLRYIAVNYVLYNHEEIFLADDPIDMDFFTYLREGQRTFYQYVHSENDLIWNTGNLNRSILWRKFWNGMWLDPWITNRSRIGPFFAATVYGKISLVFLFCMTFILGPIYMLTRAANVLFPLIVLGFIIVHGQNPLDLYDIIPIFQLTMFGMYSVLILTVVVLLIVVVVQQTVPWNILPAQHSLTANMNEAENAQLFAEISEYYEAMKRIPFRERLLIEKFGYDIGCVCISYCIKLEEWV